MAKKEDKKEDKKEEQEEEKEVEIPEKFEDIIQEIEEMSVADLAELVEILEDKFNVSATPAAVAAPAGGTSGEGGEEKPEKSEYDVMLTGIGQKKIQVIKAVRNITEKGLKDAKALVDEVSEEPQVIKSQQKKETAEELKEQLEEAGAEVELK